MTVRASVSIQDGVRDVGGGHKSRTGADCRVKGGRDSEVERISERKPSRRGREVKAEEKQGDGLGCEVQRVRRGISFSINRAEVVAEGGGGSLPPHPPFRYTIYHFSSGKCWSEPPTPPRSRKRFLMLFMVFSTI